MPGPSTAQIRRDGITFNQVTKFFFSNPQFCKRSAESEFQTVFQLYAFRIGICRVGVDLCIQHEVNRLQFPLPSLRCLRWPGKLGKKASLRLKTAMTCSQHTISSQGPEERQGGVVPSLGEITDQAVFQHTTTGCSALQGRNLYSHNRPCYTALHALQ